MKQMRNEVRPFSVHNRVGAVGKTSVMADCPFCGVRSIIFVWSFAGTGKKACSCGAMFMNRNGGESHKLVETVDSVAARLTDAGLVDETSPNDVESARRDCGLLARDGTTRRP